MNVLNKGADSGKNQDREIYQFISPPTQQINNQRAFCVSLQTSGNTIKTTGNSVSEFLPVIKDAVISWLNFTVDDIQKDAETIATELGFTPTLASSLISLSYSAYEDLEIEMGLVLPAVRVKGLEVTISHLMILIKRGLIVTIHGKEITRFLRFSRYATTFMKKINPELSLQDKLTILLTRIIDENNNGNFEYLRQIEAHGDEMSKYLMDPKTPRGTLAPEIYNMKHALITYLDALWASLDVITSLRYGDAELITDDQRLLERLGILSDDVNRQISLSEHMSEVLASGLEVLQSIYNNQLQILNNRLAMLVAWLTIIGTAVLVPNTLATIFSNPAFNMTPKDTGWYTTLLILSTIFSTLIAYWWIKKKGWLPTRVE